jgi:putative ATP-dependent endonuclease of OLD family
LQDQDIQDLERFLDATKSNLLFARKVMLVEGPAELFLIPPLVKQVMGVDLDRAGVSVIPIYGVHFDVYAKLFCADCLPKKCAIIADGDLKPSDSHPERAEEDEDELPPPPDLKDLESDHVKVFSCETTFERAVTMGGTLPMFAAAAEELGAPIVAKKLRDGFAALRDPDLDPAARFKILTPLRSSILSTANRIGKARFAQVAARHVDQATVLPVYIKTAVTWVIEP